MKQFPTRTGIGMALIGVISVLGVLGAAVAHAAINPQEFIRVASEKLRLREVGRVVERERGPQPGWHRVTILAEVVEVRTASEVKVGDRILIDWTIDPTGLVAAREQHAAAAGQAVGRQFMHEPEPPALDEKQEFWANLAPAGGRLGNVNRFAGARVNMNDAKYSGPVFVPVAGQYSFMKPSSE